MKINLFLTMFFYFLSLTISASTFERIQIVGANKGGSRIAIIKSHFGPSSLAPFVELNIVEAGIQSPLFHTGYFSTQGDEIAITKMKDLLLLENSSNLQRFAIDPNFKSQSIDAFSTDFNNQILVEADLYQSGRISRFNLFYVESSSTCNNSSQSSIALRICTLYENTPSNCSLIEPYTGLASLACFADKASFSRIIKIGNFLWFHLFLRIQPLEGLFYYSQILHGEELTDVDSL